MSSLELDDHGKASDTSVDGVGNFQAIVEAVEGTAEVKVLVSFLTEKTITEDSHGDGLVSAFGVGLVDLDFLFQLDSVVDLGAVLGGWLFAHLND
jgi:hypothetical protein